MPTQDSYDMAVDVPVVVVHSSNHTHIELSPLNDCGVPRNHVIRQVTDDKDVEQELECSRAIQRDRV